MIELTLYFMSGSKITLICDEYEFTRKQRSNLYCGYSIKNGSVSVNFVPEQLEAYTAKNIK